MKEFTTVAALCLLANVGTYAFLAQPPKGEHSVCVYAKNKGRQLNLPKPFPTGPSAADISIPEDCTMNDLISVMGEGRLKKVARKNRRTRNQKIREGKVVLNEKGEWVAK
ncbi:hypothetical protein ACHAXA_005140 [Cyclostephanos tholiformis]|uniref:Uncharacterized protein n=1 Tax=Cyclostephanos tholiformis TaxID=382380 RepID=A0ABD3RXE1_9STRA